ncbi:hypothetical protein TNCV_2490331 [Trichonephila clavipes]|nr:hypothetical protein TNCV_2490331 [Trichonephila clavipes]
MPRRSIRAHYEQLSVFERSRIIELKKGGWAYRRIAGHMGRSDLVKHFLHLLVVIRATLTAHRYVNSILKTAFQPFLLQYSGLYFLQDNAKPHTTRGATNWLTAFQTLPWSARLLSNTACLVYDGKVTASTRDVDDLF